MMDEFEIANLDRLGEHIIESLARGDARARSASCRKGTYATA